MTGPRVTDHALLRYYQRTSGVDVEALRVELSQRLARACDAAEPIGGQYRILLDGVSYTVRNNTVITVFLTEDRRR